MNFYNFFDINRYYKSESDNIIPVGEVLNLNHGILADIYCNGTDCEKFNVFFLLLNEYYYLKQEKCVLETARICGLISFYLFMLIKPPNSRNLAEIFAAKAFQLDESEANRLWLEQVKISDT